jgi:hypothetical protein
MKNAETSARERGEKMGKKKKKSRGAGAAFSNILDNLYSCE